MNQALLNAAKAADEQITAIHTAFGAPGDYGYESREGKALYELYKFQVELRAAIRQALIDDARAENAPVAKFETQRFGAVVATILESDYGAVEVQARNDGKFVLTVHSQVGETDRWQDLSATLEPKHFEMLGSIARQQPVRA